MSVRLHVSVSKKAILVWCRGCALRIVTRLLYSSVLTQTSNESSVDFLKAGTPVLQVIGVRIHCVSREYLQLFEAFLSIYI
jgi:hypothetical protein